MNLIKPPEYPLLFNVLQILCIVMCFGTVSMYFLELFSKFYKSFGKSRDEIQSNQHLN